MTVDGGVLDACVQLADGNQANPVFGKAVRYLCCTIGNAALSPKTCTALQSNGLGFACSEAIKSIEILLAKPGTALSVSFRCSCCHEEIPKDVVKHCKKCRQAIYCSRDIPDRRLDE